MPSSNGYFSIGPTGKYVANSASDKTYPGKEAWTEFEDYPIPLEMYSSFSGSDIICTAIVPGITTPYTFATLRTISYSIVRDKRPLRILGVMNPIGWTKSNRLIVGTLVFTSFDRYVGFQMTGTQTSPEKIVLADMLPPFDITITGLNEYGQTSRLSIRGVRIVDEGAVIGVDDMYVEQTHTYVAQDIVPWIPTSAESLEDSVDK